MCFVFCLSFRSKILERTYFSPSRRSSESNLINDNSDRDFYFNSSSNSSTDLDRADRGDAIGSAVPPAEAIDVTVAPAGGTIGN